MQRIAEGTQTIQDEREFNYHLDLLELLAMCCWGKIAYTELQCQALIPISFIVETIMDSSTLTQLKTAMLRFFSHVCFSFSFSFSFSSFLLLFFSVPKKKLFFFEKRYS